MARKPPKVPSAPYTYTETRTKISDREIAQAAYNAGFRGQALITAIAVAIGESHGNRTAIADNGEFSIGLWQINVNGYLGSRLQRWGLLSWEQLYDPDTNARAAFDLSNSGKKFTPWSIFKHNAHLKYMERATIAANAVTSSPLSYTSPTPRLVPQPMPQVQPSNVLPPARVNVSDPMVTIILVGIASVILIGILLMTRKRE